MNMPGFTAESSLYNSKEMYTISEPRVEMNGDVRPADCTLDCLQQCAILDPDARVICLLSCGC